jgi:hypothetical protein
MARKAAGEAKTADTTRNKATSRAVKKDRGKADAGVHGEKVQTYRVGAAGTILDGKVYAEGDTVRLPPSQARAHTDRGVRLEAMKHED